jgi:hypothetical protein
MRRGRLAITDRVKAASDEAQALQAEYDKLRLRAKQVNMTDSATWLWGNEWRDFVYKHTGKRRPQGKFPAVRIMAEKHSLSCIMIERYRAVARNPEMLKRVSKDELSVSAAYAELHGRAPGRDEYR